MFKFAICSLSLLLFISEFQYTLAKDDIQPVVSGKYRDKPKVEEFDNDNDLDSSIKNFTKINQKYIINCVNVSDFKIGKGSLLNHLIKLQTCDAYMGTRLLQDACNTRLFAITTFYKLVYIHFCEPELYHLVCGEGDAEDFEGSGEHPTEEEHLEGEDHLEEFGADFEFIIHGENVQLKSEKFKAEENEFLLESSCSNIDDFFEQLYDFEANVVTINDYPMQIDFKDDGHKHHKIPFIDVAVGMLRLNQSYIVPSAEINEWFVPVVPFCKPFTCVSTKNRYDQEHVSSYSCMPSGCRTVVICVIVLDAILATAIVVANSLVLGVAARTKIMRNIPGYFKISLAVADILVGAMVLPGSIYNAYALYLKPMPWREPNQVPKPTDYFARSYLDFMGFFTVFPICLSLYTMGVASLDRYLAITKPFKYRQGQYLTKKRCIAVFTTIYIFAVIMALFPIVTHESYFSTAFTLFISTGTMSAFVYAVGLGLPLIAVWTFNTAMLKNVCAGGEKRRSIRASRPPTLNNNNNGFPAYSMEESGANHPPTDITNMNQSVENLDDTKQEMDTYVYQIKEEPENYSQTNENDNHSRRTSSSSAGISYYRKDPYHCPPSCSTKPSKMQSHKNRRQSLFNVSLNFVQSHLPHMHHSRSTGHAHEMEKRLARTLSIMIGAFSVALVPCIVVLLVGALIIKRVTPGVWPEEYSPKASIAIHSSVYAVSRLILSNSFWNCIIYSIRNRHFRRAMFAIFLCSRRKIDRRLRQSISISSQFKRNSNGNDRHPVLSKANSASSAQSVASAPAHGYGQSRRSTGMWSLSTMQSSRFNSNIALTNAHHHHIRTPVTKTISLPDMTARKEQHDENELNRTRRLSEGGPNEPEHGVLNKKLSLQQSIDIIEEE